MSVSVLTGDGQNICGHIRQTESLVQIVRGLMFGILYLHVCHGDRNGNSFTMVTGLQSI